MKTTTELKAEILRSYLEQRGSMTQAAFCQQVTAATGIALSSRTLRSWLVGAHVAATPDGQVRAIVLDALEAVRAAEARLQALLEAVDAASARATAADSEASTSPSSSKRQDLPAGIQPAAADSVHDAGPAKAAHVAATDPPAGNETKPCRFIFDDR